MRTYVRGQRRYDWIEIRAYYDAGHTLRECQERFGFSVGAWDAAVGRGDVVPRHAGPKRYKHETREAVRERLAAGMSHAMIAFELGLSRGTVCYHARQLGMTSDARYGRRYDWAEIQAAHDAKHQISAAGTATYGGGART